MSWTWYSTDEHAIDDGDRTTQANVSADLSGAENQKITPRWCTGDVVQSIRSWVNAKEQNHILWITGRAGCGKTTLARHITQEYGDMGCLGASFFFPKKTLRAPPMTTFADSLARQLAMVKTSMRESVSGWLWSLVANSTSGENQKSTNQALQTSISDTGRPVLVLVIDALDECVDSDDARVIAALLNRARSTVHLEVRILVTSRPETPVWISVEKSSIGRRRRPSHGCSIQAHVKEELNPECTPTFPRDLVSIQLRASSVLGSDERSSRRHRRSMLSVSDSDPNSITSLWYRFSHEIRDKSGGCTDRVGAVKLTLEDPHAYPSIVCTHEDSVAGNLLMRRNEVSMLRDRGMYMHAESCVRSMLRDCERVLGPTNPFTMQTMDSLALITQMQGRYREAEELDRLVLKEKTSVLGHDHRETLKTASNLAAVLKFQGRYDDAAAIYRQLSSACEKVHGRLSVETLTVVANLASVLRNQGSHEEAEALSRRALHGSRRIVHRQHPLVLTNVDNLASVLRCRGKYQEAEDLNREALEGYVQIFGESHADTLTSLGNLASLLLHQGKHQEALSCCVTVLDGIVKVVGEDHPDTLTAMCNLAAAYHGLDRWQEAEVLLVRVVEKRNAMLGENHPTTLTAMANLIATYQAQGRWRNAEQLSKKVMETSIQSLGLGHPRTLAAMAHLVSIYWKQGQRTQAESLGLQLLEARKRMTETGGSSPLAGVDTWS